MTDRRRRPKASQLDPERHLTDPAYGFAAAFPEVTSVDVTVAESGSGIGSWNHLRRYTLENLPDEYVDCRNPLCYGGGIALGALLRDAVRAHRTSLDVECLCVADEASARGGLRYGPCLNTFTVAIRVAYRHDAGAG